MEKVIFKNSRNLSLVGNLQTSQSKSIIILSHALANDKSERGKLDAVANKLNESGFNTLAFDFSGCGESDDDTLTIGKEVEDLKSAINFVKSKGFENIALFGHSTGALVSLYAYNPEIKTIVLWSPVTNKVRYRWEDKLSKEQLEELTEKGYFTRTRKNAIREIYHIDKQMLTDRDSVNQKELLKEISCPVLIIQGTKDTSIPIEDSKNALKQLSKESQLEIVENADHDFTEHVNKLVELSNEWFLKHLER
ncbi:MAG: alpha/beta fold hydrolase [Nanoarchaeota archaeon]|nr:alpha/beta fold hydrolase [Nanoarchaeota archaeon]